MPAVLEGIAKMTRRYITFPYTIGELANIKRQFASMYGFPNVISTIDYIHIAIRAPHENKFIYVNQKHLHLINVQVICEPNLILTIVVA